MNLLSVGAAYGLLVLVFQKGVGAGLFGFRDPASKLDAALPVLHLFGLSMDYHVFLLSRIREHYDPPATTASQWPPAAAIDRPVDHRRGR